jgi:hypothetical protein
MDRTTGEDVEYDGIDLIFSRKKKEAVRYERYTKSGAYIYEKDHYSRQYGYY